MGTRLEEIRWARKSSLSDSYGWETLNHPHRAFLIDRVVAVPSLHSLLEVGCGVGTNLYLLAKKMPQSELLGIDINPNLVKVGNAWFKQEGISNIKLSISKVNELHAQPPFDVVITDAFLMYIGPDKIRGVMKDLLNIARKALIIVEWHSPKPEPLGFYERNWVRIYVILANEFSPEATIKVLKLPKGGGFDDEMWKKYGTLIEVIKAHRENSTKDLRERQNV